MKDYLIKALTCEERVSVYICSSTALVEEARQRFDMYPTSAAALGRVLSVGSMMGSMLKSEKEAMRMQNRIGSCVRNTKETQIELEINLDGSGEAAVDTGIPFFDHMLN